MAVTTKEEIYAILEDNSIEYHLLEHDAVYTIDDMKLVEGMKIEDVCKNLFLRDERGKKHFLVVISEEKSADLKALREKLGTSRLGFASEDRLMKYLGLIKGAVTPLGVINDKDCAVQ
ncbi:MAG: YbaK/EbsC family protein, partial [Synergistaceae bacterium]